MRAALIVSAAAAAMLLGACGEKPQTAGSRKADAQASDQPAKSAFVAPGWKAGDATSWEEQIQKARPGPERVLARAGRRPVTTLKGRR